MGAVLAVEEAKQLLKLFEAGRLYEVEAWIRAGRSLTIPNEVRKTPLLTVAMSAGFHSLVELAPAPRAQPGGEEQRPPPSAVPEQACLH